MDLFTKLILKKENLENKKEYFESTIDIYYFSFLMNFYVLFFNHLLSYNPYQVLIFLTFLYSFLKYSCNYSITSFFFHPIWYRRFYNIALPQLITSVNNVLILNNDYNLISSTIQTGCVFIAINYNFDNLEISKSNNIRGIITFLVLMFKYIICLW